MMQDMFNLFTWSSEALREFRAVHRQTCSELKAHQVRLDFAIIELAILVASTREMVSKIVAYIKP